MGGGLLQLVAYGAQDIYLTGNPEITYFKTVYRKHTNFAIESIEQHFDGTADFGKKVTVSVSRNGDLIGRTYIKADLPSIQTDGASGFSWTEELGHFLVKSIEIEIGGQIIDKHYGTWLSIWSSLTLDRNHETGYNRMIGNIGLLAGNNLVAAVPANTLTPIKTIYVPLQFWFNKNPALALPLIALQYHEVKFHIEFETFENLKSNEFSSGTITPVNPSLTNVSMWIDYIYLDTEERRRFAQNSHEYLIEQVQFSENISLLGKDMSIYLDFNHPVKEMVWVIQSNETTTGGTTKLGIGNNYTDNSGSGNVHTNVNVADNPVQSSKLLLNGHERFSVRDGLYFNNVQPYQHHTSIPPVGINVYSFALRPEDHQPSGTLNLSRIDNAVLQINLSPAAVAHTDNIVKIFVVNYNVLRIMSGLSGLAFSN